MRLVVKYGGTSISTAKNIQTIAKHISSLSKKDELVVVCSAVSETTDDLLEISESIKKENKAKAEQLASKNYQQTQTISKKNNQKI